MEFTLERAIEIAINAHEGQVDRQGMPYILHPMRVMSMVEGVEAQIVAALHDTVEDTAITFEYLEQEGCPQSAINSIRLLTHEEGFDGNHVDYARKIEKIRDSGDQVAIDVKFADNTDNMNPTRIDDPGERDFIRWDKYYRSRETLRPHVSAYLRNLKVGGI